MSVTNSDIERFFAFGGIEWLHYMKYRPAYPESLKNLILSHHQQYSNNYDLAHDVGGGVGVFAPVLANEFGFKHVHVSDPGMGNMKQAQELLSNWFAKQHRVKPSFKTTLTMSRNTGEELHTCTPSHSVDLVTVMEAAHWMDGSKLMSSAAEALKSNGTLAMVIYCAAGSIKGNERANTAFKKAVGGIWAHVYDTKKESGEVGVDEFERGLKQGCTGLDFVDIDADTWKNVRRMRIRGAGRGEHPHNVPYSTAPDHYAPSHVKEEEDYEYYEESDELGQGWEKVVDHDWFQGYIQSMEDPEYVTNMPEYKDLMKIMEEEFPEGNIPVEWTTDVVLASRR